MVEFASHYRSVAPLAVQQQDHQHTTELAFTGYKALALMRLRRYTLASDELAQLRDLPGQQLPAGVPFGLLYLRAQLPAYLGSPQLTLDRLYQLKDYCQQQQQWPEQQQQQDVPDVLQEDRTDQLQQPQPPETAAAAAAWQQRLHAVNSSLILHYWQQGSVTTAFQLLDQQLQEQPHSMELWSLAGRLQLQLNMLHQAHASFTKVQQIFLQQQQRNKMAATGYTMLHKQHLAALQRLVHHNWGCYHALSHNMTLAQHEFSIAQHIRDPSSAPPAVAAATDPLVAVGEPQKSSVDHGFQAAATKVDGVAAANSAVCLLHMGELTEAISALEAGLQQHPQEFLQVSLRTHSPVDQAL